MTSDGYGGIREGGPYFDDLVVGQVFDWAPVATLSSGMAAAHQAIVGDRMRLALDTGLCAAVIGLPGPLAHPGLVCDVAIGQSTLVTQRVKANLFYRGLRFHRFPLVGDSIYTRTEVVGLRSNSVKPGRAPTGMVALRMITIDQADQLVLDFYRCAMLPASPDFDPSKGPGDDLSTVGADAPAADPTCGWDADAFRQRIPGPHFDAGLAGAVLQSTADVVSSAPELARLTLNIAATHHDSRVGGR
ncbi:MaoC family dehydratase, partial [Mycobacterium sp.]|uniref:MaoC family dehydratase n=1 Tax=Mycobacterium sp. TaxID=1785 RepID=UPI003C70EDF8